MAGFQSATVRNRIDVLCASNRFQKLSGTFQITGGVAANPAVPEVSAGGVVETAAYGTPVAPGDLVAIFGSKLASDTLSAQSLPLPTQLLSTSVLLGGKTVPLFYASDGQLNAVIPYDLPPNSHQALLVTRGSAYSVPRDVIVGVAKPAVFTVDSSGTGQGDVFKTDATGRQILADKNSPAKPGNDV